MLKVELIRERPPALEAALEEVVQALDDALGLRIRRLAEEGARHVWPVSTLCSAWHRARSPLRQLVVVVVAA
jgi:hypothetical protein